MKLRIRGNSIRLRLLQSEVASLSETKRLSETISFGPGTNETLTYAVQISETAKAVSAGMCENEVCIILPKITAKEWIDSEQIGVAASFFNGEEGVEILVEKDFVCLTRTDDPDNVDAFPNPDADC